MKKRSKIKVRFLASKRAVTRVEAAAIIVALIASFTVAAGGIYYLLAVANSSQIGISPTATPTVQPTPSPSIVAPTSTPTIMPKPSQTPSPTSSPSTTPAPTTQPAPTSAPAPTTNPTPQPTPSPTPTPYPKYSFTDAVAQGYAEANITGLGYSSGNSIILSIRRLVNSTIEIEPFPAGTLLVTSSSAQNMVVLRLHGIITEMGNYSFWYYDTDRIILSSSNMTQYLFIAYCVNFHKGNPSTSTLYSVEGMVDPNVVKILNIVNQNTLPSNVTTTGAIQTAISVVTDNISRSELQSTWPSCVAEIPSAKIILETAGIDISNALLFAA